MSGAEVGDADAEGVLGVFAGYASGDVNISFNAGDGETDSLFGGLYWKRDYGTHRLHAAFMAGLTDNEHVRNVNGTRAVGNYDGLFVSPSVTVSVPLDFMEFPAFLSARASYMHLRLDGYTETGTALPLTIAERDVSVVNLRAQINLPSVREDSEGNISRINLSFGVDATRNSGSDNVAAMVGGTAFGFNADLQDNEAGFARLNVSRISADGRHSLGFNGEVQSGFGSSFAVTGELKASYHF